jgi:glycosyltransferase involved in cell wall biosynthesis
MRPDRPVPVLLLAQELTQGGSERQLTEIAKALDRSRFAPHVGVFRPGGIRVDELRAAGVPVACFSMRSFASPQVMRAAVAMGRYTREHGIRLVHSFDTPANVFAVPVARAFGVPAVISSQRAFRELAPLPYRHLLRLTDQIADAIVVNCRALERHLITDEKVAAARIRLCYNGIDTERFSPHPGPRPEALEGASLVAGAVCALRPEKGLPTLLTAFAEARRRQPEMRLAVVGSGPVLPELLALRDRLDLAGSCIFAPTTADAAGWLRAMDIFVLPSLSEAFSNSLMEAMACGCAAVASEVGGNPELVAHGERGLLFRPRDARQLAAHLVFLAEHAEERRRLAGAGSRFVRQNFSLARAAERMAEIYTGLLQDAQFP